MSEKKFRLEYVKITFCGIELTGIEQGFGPIVSAPLIGDFGFKDSICFTSLDEAKKALEENKISQASFEAVSKMLEK